MRTLLFCCPLMLTALTAFAAPTIDGTKDVSYGDALAVQTVETAFQNNLNELNAAYATVESGRLYLMLTGNIAGLNRLEIFIDSKAGGQSVFDSSGNDNASAMDGLVFDVGFTADYHMIARRGDDGGNDTFDLDFADLGAQSATGYADLFGGLDGMGTTGTGVNAQPIQIAYDNSNVAGVGGNTPNAANQAAALAVTTGLELAIDLADLGYTGGPINIMAGINNNGHNFWSNQFLGGLAAPQSFLGSDGQGAFTGTGDIDFTLFRGNQYFTVVPEPSSWAILGLGLLAVIGLIRRSRR